MILNYNKLGKQNKGSSLTFSALGGRGKEKINKPAAKIFASPSEGEAEGGCGGNSASPEPKRSPAALLVQSRTPQKSFLFLLEEKIGGAQIGKSEENFFAGWRALASGGGAERQSSQSGFSSKKVRILTKRHRQLGNVFVGSPSARARQPVKKFSSHFLICARPIFSSPPATLCVAMRAGKRKRKLFCGVLL